MRVQHGLLFAYQRLCRMSEIILDSVRVPLGPLKIHANGVLLGGLSGQSIVLLWLSPRR